MLKRLLALGRNVPFPAGLAVIAFGIGLIYIPAGLIAAGIALCFVGWAVESDGTSPQSGT